jgi:putative tryptophan/tyrosine transport system substrate-binding protein
MTDKAFSVAVFVGMAMLVGAPLFAAEEPGRLPRIGVLWLGLVDPWVRAFHEGLRENGYVDGATAVVDIRTAGKNPELGPRLAGELIALDPDVIYAVPAAFVKDVVDAQKRAGKQIPIVLLSADPVAEGLVASAAHPGGNITGVAATPNPEDLMTKHLQLLKEMVPRMRRVACLIDTTAEKTASLKAKAALDRAGPKIGVRVDSINVAGPDDLERALSEVARKRVDAMIISISPVSLATRSRIIAFASKHHLPTVYWEEVFAYEGGLMSYGASIADRYRLAAGVIAKVLRGGEPADIPVDYSMRFRLVVNSQTAKALGIRIPESVLIQADEVIR